MWTENQQKAIDAVCADNIVSAAAGSGKTAVMVERIINRVLSGKADIDKLLVVTFTNAAATELKTRLMNKIMDALADSPNPDHLNRQLMLINNASICTIDSFCLNVLRNNFYKLGLDPSVKVADNAELELIKNDVLNDIFEMYYNSEDNEFLKIVDSYTVKKDSELLDLVLSLYEFSSSLEGGVDDLNMLKNLFSDKRVWQGFFIEKAHRLSRRAMRYYDRAVKMVQFTPEYSKVHEQLCFEKGNYENILKANTWADMHKITSCFEFPRFVLPKCMSETEKEEIKAYRNDGKDIHKGILADFSVSEEDLLSDILETKKTLDKLIELTVEFEREFSRVKREKGIVDFSDVEHLTLKLLKNPDGSQSDTAISLMKKFTEIYVDEFQDCNSVQASIFSLISGENIGNPNMFRVGDMKQSIYGFRGSEPEHFKKALSVCTEYGLPDEKHNKIILNKNFRSRDIIINSVNRIFSRIMSEEYGEIDYNEEEYLYYNEGSYDDVNKDFNKTELVLIDTENIEDPDLNDDSLEDIKAIEYEAIYTANRINDMVSDENYKVFDSKLKEYRRVKYSDIVILLRSGAEKMASFSRILTTASIPVYCEQGDGYYDSPEIVFLTNFLKIIDNPYDDIALLSVMRHPVIGFADDDFVSIRLTGNKGYFYTSIQRYVKDNSDDLCEKLREFLSSVKGYYKKSKYLSADKLLWEIIRDTEYISYLAFTANPEIRIANVRALLSRAYEFEKSSYKGIFDFIRYIDSVKKSNNDVEPAKTLSDDEDVVRIMTIHKSKGLEFPIVFLCNANKQFNDMDIRQSKILMHPSCGFGLNYYDFKNHYYYELPQKKYIRDVMRKEMLSEEMRILYVALTRAREKLIITGAAKKACSYVGGYNSYIKYLNSMNLDDYISKAKSYTDWLFGAIFTDGSYSINSYDGNELFSITTLKKSEVVLKLKEGYQNRGFNFSNSNPETDKIVDEILEFSYPHDKLSDIPSNLSVTELKRREQEDENVVYTYYSRNKLPTPEFYGKNQKLSAADIGTLTHLVMEKLEFSKISKESDVKSQIDLLSEKGFFPKEYIKYIKCDNIYRILNTSVGKQLCTSESTLRREFSFKYLMDVSELNPEVSSDEKIVIQGMIDAFFENENSELIVIDYKTDKVINGTDEIKKRYMSQLKYYKIALEKALNKRVVGSYLFLLDSGDVVDCNV